MLASVVALVAVEEPSQLMPITMRVPVPGFCSMVGGAAICHRPSTGKEPLFLGLRPTARLSEAVSGVTTKTGPGLDRGL